MTKISLKDIMQMTCPHKSPSNGESYIEDNVCKLCGKRINERINDPVVNLDLVCKNLENQDNQSFENDVDFLIDLNNFKDKLPDNIDKEQFFEKYYEAVYKMSMSVEKMKTGLDYVIIKREEKKE